MLVGRASVQDTSTMIMGDATPLNEAPIRWWGGRRSWVDDWDNAAPQSSYAICGEPDCAMGMGFYQPRCEHPSTFGRGEGRRGAFLDEEIRASFDGVGCVDTGFAELLAPGLVNAPVDINNICRMDGVPVTRAGPMPITPGGAGLRTRNEGLGYGEMEVGLPPVDRGSAMKRASDNLTHCNGCPVHPHGNAGSCMPDNAVSRCFVILGMLVVDADDSAHRFLYRGMADAVVDSAMRRRTRLHRTRRACLVHRSHIHNHSWYLRRNPIQAHALP